MITDNMQTKEQLIQHIDELTVELEWYKEQFRLFQQQRFGSKSEQTHSEQMSLFNEAESDADTKVEEPTFEEITYKRRKEKRSKEELLEDLRVEQIVHELSEEERLCPHGHGPLKEIGQVVTREIGIIPAEVYVIENIQKKYACEPCEKEGIETPIMIAPKPKRAIPGSMASSSIIAYVADQKYTNGMPLYRQEQQFKRYGIDLSRQTLANWMIKAAEWFDYLYNRMKTLLTQHDVIHCDETTILVLNETDKESTAKSYMWLYRTGKFSNTSIVLYNYQPTRSGDHPKEFLKGFNGYAHLDGYAGYNKVDNLIRVGCFAHARRGFNDSLIALGKDNKFKTARTISNKGLEFCNRLFKIEQDISNLTLEKRYSIRQEHSRPVLDDFLAWLHESKEKVLPKSKVGEAITYCLNQWPYLVNYLLDGRLENSNNRAERSIKPFVIGRKSWLFSNTKNGAQASATIYSIIETAKENKLKPFDYLTFLLDKLPSINVENITELDKLLPWSESIPESCKLKK
jgi:transposase